MQQMQMGRIVLDGLFNISAKLDSFDWKEFRPGVKIHRLYGNQERGPSAALLWYEPGAGVPEHEHLGYEHIFILSDSQSDRRGENGAGTLIINPPGTRHS